MSVQQVFAIADNIRKIEPASQDEHGSQAIQGQDIFSALLLAAGMNGNSEGVKDNKPEGEKMEKQPAADPEGSKVENAFYSIVNTPVNAVADTPSSLEGVKDNKSEGEEMEKQSAAETGGNKVENVFYSIVNTPVNAVVDTPVNSIMNSNDLKSDNLSRPKVRITGGIRAEVDKGSQKMPAEPVLSESAIVFQSDNKDTSPVHIPVHLPEHLVDEAAKAITLLKDIVLNPDLKADAIMQNMGVSYKSLEKEEGVIPTKVGVQSFQSGKKPLDFLFHGNDDFFKSLISDNNAMVNAVKGTVYTDNNIESAQPVYKHADQGNLIQLISQQIIRAAHIGNHTARISLRPAELGDLRLDISVVDKNVNALIVVENEDVKKMIESGFNQLRDELKNQGLNVEQFKVEINRDNFNDNSKAMYDKEEKGTGKWVRTLSGENSSDRGHLISMPISMSNGSRGMISIFA